MDDDETKLDATRDVLKRLPPRNLPIVKELFAFLKEVEAQSAVNKMTASNLAIVMGPNLIWSQSSAASLECRFEGRQVGTPEDGSVFLTRFSCSCSNGPNQRVYGLSSDGLRWPLQQPLVVN